MGWLKDNFAITAPKQCGDKNVAAPDVKCTQTEKHDTHKDGRDTMHEWPNHNPKTNRRG